MISTSFSSAKPALRKLIDKSKDWATPLHTDIHTDTLRAMNEGDQEFGSSVFLFLGQNENNTLKVR